MAREDQFEDQIERGTAVYCYSSTVSERLNDWQGTAIVCPD